MGKGPAAKLNIVSVVTAANDPEKKFYRTVGKVTCWSDKFTQQNYETLVDRDSDNGIQIELDMFPDLDLRVFAPRKKEETF